MTDRTGEPDLFATIVSAGAESCTAAPAPDQRPDPTGRTPVGVVPFPLHRRVGKIRDVATKLQATKTDRHAEFYRAQVTHALGVHLQAKKVPYELHPGEIARFWQGVELELLRRQVPPQPQGAA